jgi:hypothetical protein
VWLAVQQLLGNAPVVDRPLQAPQGAAEKLAVGVSQRRCAVAAPNQPLSLRDPVREARGS